MDDKVVNSLSQRRFSTYERAADSDRIRASTLYIWNARIAATFFLPLQFAEVCLRNRVAAGIADSFGQRWWEAPAFKLHLNAKTISKLEAEVGRLTSQLQRLDGDHVIASLSFGFWVNILTGGFNAPIWSRQLRKQFPSLPPEVNRKQLWRHADAALKLRNRISHHEPIIGLDLKARHHDVLTLINWMCPATHDWLQPHLTFDQVYSERP